MDEEPQEAEEAPAAPAEKLQQILDAGNLADALTPEKLTEIGRDVVAMYRLDKSSMSEWLEKMQKAIDLAKLVKSSKDYPFVNASNIKYPLVASAALQFNARAYPAIVPSGDIVSVRVWGKDNSGAKAARGERVASYMSWQLATEMLEWESDTDKLLVQVPIVGDMFRKVWFDGERARSRLVAPGKFIVNANCQALSDVPRCTEELELYPYEVKEREESDRFAEIDYDDAPDDKQKSRQYIEQHARIDLDGDGYPEPYVVTVYVATEKVVRMVPDFRMDDVSFEMGQQMVNGPMGPEMQDVPTEIKKIRRRQYFVHYQLMPGMDGSFWGTGLGILLGDISEAVNSSFNMLIDAGHYASLGGGFIGSEFRLKGGAKNMRPGEWRQVPTNGGDIRSGVVPMTFPGPDQTLFAMLGMLTEAGKEISSTKDIMTGETERAMTATATMALIEQGLKVFSASYKRLFRGLKQEFALIAEINSETVSPERYNAFLDEEQPFDPAADFGAADMDVQPVADPGSVTKMQAMAKAQILLDMAEKGLVDPAEATDRILQAAGIADVEKLIPQMDPAAAEEAQMMKGLQLIGLKTGLAQQMAEIDLTIAKIDDLAAKTAETMAGINNADRQIELQAVKMMMMERKDEITRALAGTNSGVARPSGDAGAQVGA